MTEPTTLDPKATDRASKGAFGTPDEAKAARPGNPRLKLHAVTAPDGRVWHTWAASNWDALAQVAKAHGYAASSAGKVPSRDKVAGLIAQLSADDRAALLAQMGGTGPVAEKGGKKAGK